MLITSLGRSLGGHVCKEYGPLNGINAHQLMMEVREADPAVKSPSPQEMGPWGETNCTAMPRTTTGYAEEEIYNAG